MPVPSLISDLSTTAASNSPAGGDQVFPDLDNFLRFYGACIAQLRDGTGFTAGAIGTSDLEDGLLTADAAGRLKMADAFVTLAKLADGILTADAAGRLKMADLFVTTSKLADGAVTLTKTDAALQEMLLPAGAVMPFARSTAPTGWLACDGSTVSRTTYAALFSAIGTTFGAGDGSTTFRLPDLRGEFIRGHDGGRGVDSGRVFGSWQADDLKSHSHTVNTGFAYAGGGSNRPATPDGASSGDMSTGSTGGSETRPRNVALLYAIKT